MVKKLLLFAFILPLGTSLLAENPVWKPEGNCYTMGMSLSGWESYQVFRNQNSHSQAASAALVCRNCLPQSRNALKVEAETQQA